jgi:hypothetical protein
MMGKELGWRQYRKTTLPLQIHDGFPFFKTGSPSETLLSNQPWDRWRFSNSYFLCIFCIRKRGSIFLNHLQLKHLLSYCERTCRIDNFASRMIIFICGYYFFLILETNSFISWIVWLPFLSKEEQCKDNKPFPNLIVDSVRLQSIKKRANRICRLMIIFQMLRPITFGSFIKTDVFLIYHFD